MSLKTRKRLIYAKAESTYGTDSSPASADAVLVANIQANPLTSNPTERPADRSKFGNKRQLHVDVHSSLSFDVELVGSGTLGTAPAFGKLLEACGCAETVVASTSVAYTPDTDATDSLTIVYNLDGNQHKMTGCRGSFQIVYNDLQVPVIRFTFMGIYNAPTAVALGAVAGEADYQFPKPVTSTNTDLTIDSQACVLRSFTFDGGQQVTYFDDEGVVEITDRRSGGSTAFLMQAVGTKNWLTTIVADSLLSMELNHYQTDAYRAILHTPSATLQLVNPQMQDDRGRAVIQCGLSFEPTSSLDDEWELKFAAAA